MLSHRAPPSLTIAIIASCGLFVSMQFTLIIPLLADLPKILETSAENTSWLVTSAMLCGAVSTPIVARMADMYGKRLMLIIALVVMVAGSLICALEVGFTMLIVGRAMQGFAASLIAVGISILRDELPKERVSTAVALMSATMGIGAALGLPLSGVFYEHFGWHSIFWFSAAIGTLLIVVLIIAIDESAVRTPGRFDLVGAILFSGALVTLLLPISKGNAWGWSSTTVVSLFAVSGVTFALWLPIQLRRSQPMVDIRLARQRPILTTNIASLFAGFAMFANLLLTSQTLQWSNTTGVGMGLDAGRAGIAMIPMGLTMVVMAPLTGRMLDRFGAKHALILGSMIMAVTYAARTFFDNNVAEIVIGSTFVGVGTAIAFAAMPTLIMGAVPITQTAAANGLSTLVRAIGSSMASTVCAVILAAHVGGEPTVPTTAGVQIILWISAGTAFAAAAIAVTIPIARPTVSALRGPATDDRQETVAKGYVKLDGKAYTARPAVVSVLTLDGEEVDWNRVDVDGSYSVALPGPGTYVFTINAQGWRPTSNIIDFADHDLGPDLDLKQQLTLSGQITLANHKPARSAVVSLLRTEGELVRSLRCDADGRYRIALPPPGPYIVTAFDPATRHTAAHKLVIPVENVKIDLELAP